MSVTPVDIRNKKFARGLSGYSPAQVDDFLDQICGELERLARENVELNRRLREMEGEINRLRESESELNRTLLSAQRVSDSIVQEARAQAEMILQNAQEQCVREREEQQARLDAARREEAQLLQRAADMRRTLCTALAEQMEWLEANLPDVGGEAS